MGSPEQFYLLNLFRSQQLIQFVLQSLRLSSSWCEETIHPSFSRSKKSIHSQTSVHHRLLRLANCRLRVCHQPHELLSLCKHLLFSLMLLGSECLVLCLEAFNSVSGVVLCRVRQLVLVVRCQPQRFYLLFNLFKTFICCGILLKELRLQTDYLLL